ncbi:MAG: ABC transporter ATP-binding protein [Betaproteobacteria bacterium TMED41]|nr:MAG: ABC transporter ATP-binding protein [Betaproteobacteria bacterium TMED41]
MDADSIIRFKELSFEYASKKIINNLSFNIPKGKVVAIMGGSGVGKTTLLKIISGLIPSTANQVYVFDKDLALIGQSKKNELRKQIGLLFQFGALFTDLSCFENVAFPLREHANLSPSLLKTTVMLKLECVGLRGAAHLMPSEISGGMARRVALARAIALGPKLILYDEPFSGLDPISLGVTAQLIRKLNDALGSTSVLVTHDVVESFEIADHVYLLAPSENGAVLIGSGTPEEISKNKDPYIQQFINGQQIGPVKFHYPAEQRKKFFLSG